jgi:hypothetical protein
LTGHYFPSTTFPGPPAGLDPTIYVLKIKANRGAPLKCDEIFSEAAHQFCPRKALPKGFQIAFWSRIESSFREFGWCGNSGISGVCHG